MQILNSLRATFHREAPVHSICLYRAAIGALVAYEVLTWLPHTTELFSNAGFHLPNVAWVPAPSPTVAFLLCALLFFSSLMVALGLFTRAAILSTLALWGYFYCLDSINEKSAQTITLVALSALLFSACGHRYSLDDLRRRRAGLPRKPGVHSIFIQRLLQIEFAQIYFFCGVAKMTNPSWVNGTTFYWILNCRWATPLGIYLSSLDPNLIARAGGLGTILFELFIGFMLFVPPLRPIAIALGLAFHTGIQLTLWIGTLGLHFMLALIFLFPDPDGAQRRLSALWARLSPRFRESPSIMS